MNILYAFSTVVLTSGAALAGWVLCARRARRELTGVKALAARGLASAEENVQRLAVELGRARSTCDGQAQRLEDEGEARERLEGELVAGRAAELALRDELACLRADLGARAASLELARGVAREAEEVRDAQVVELDTLRAALVVFEQRTAALRSDEERRRAEQAALTGELAQLRTETVRVRREAGELRHTNERQAEALGEAVRRRAEKEAELSELAARLARTAGEVVAADERAHRLEAELEALRESALPLVRAVPEPQSEPEVLLEPRTRRTAVVVPGDGQGDLWAE